MTSLTIQTGKNDNNTLDIGYWISQPHKMHVHDLKSTKTYHCTKISTLMHNDSRQTLSTTNQAAQNPSKNKSHILIFNEVWNDVPNTIV
jgi:hypothetical protein